MITPLKSWRLAALRKLSAGRSRPQFSILHRPVVHILIFVDILFGARLYRAIGDFLQPLLLGTVTALILLYIAIAMLRLKLVAPYLSMGVIIVIGMQIYVFSYLSYTVVSVNAGFQYVAVAGFVIFYILSLDGQREYFLKALISYTTLYSLIYSLLSILLYAGIFPSSILQGLLANDVERGNRIFLYSAAAALAYFFWLHRAKQAPTTKNLLMAVATFAAIILSQSRVFGLVVVVITILYLTQRRSAYIRPICLVAFWSILVINLYGLIDANWNPYSLFEGDSSGAFRIMEYNLARTIILEHPWFGLGIAANSKDAWFYIGQDYFAANDLGSIGVWIDWGLLGFIFFIFGTHVTCTPLRGVASDYSIPLFLTGCFLAAFATISPSIMYPGGSITFAIVLGFHLDRPILRKNSLPWSTRKSVSAT